MPYCNKNNLPRVNSQIRVPRVKLIDQNSEVVGIVDTAKALDMARKANLDLVEVASSPTPVCKLLDFGKLKYENKKKAQESKKKQKIAHIKEIKLKPRIGQNDLMIKIKQMRSFIQNKDKVKVSLTFRGREIVHSETGIKVFETIINELGELVKLEVAPKRQGNQLGMILIPS